MEGFLSCGLTSDCACVTGGQAPPEETTHALRLLVRPVLSQNIVLESGKQTDMYVLQYYTTRESSSIMQSWVHVCSHRSQCDVCLSAVLLPPMQG